MAATMRVLMLSWEYPPLVVGGLGRTSSSTVASSGAGGSRVSRLTSGRSVLWLSRTLLASNIRVAKGTVLAPPESWQCA
ncbi:MAG: hypothetical protein GEU83_00255 [Pseudonocardiaceae bacterium]|nr:hypothetical protein [Pseudonocardiaceae bacterium]